MQNFIYSRRRPFHPQRLWALVYNKFILQLEHPEDDDDEEEEGEEEGDDDLEMADYEATSDAENDPSSDQGEDSSPRRHSVPSSVQSSNSTAQTVPSPSADKQNVRLEEDDAMIDSDLVTPSNDEILAIKRSHPVFARLFRSKGEFFLATRPHRAGDWSQAGAMLTMTGGRPWFCTLPPEEYTTGDEEVDGLVLHDIKQGGEWGDRRQEMVFIGENLDRKTLEKLLDECLLTDDEWQKWEGIMRKEDLDDEARREALEDVFDDGFPDWASDDEDHEGHDHAHPGGLRSIKQHLQEVD